MQGKISLIEIQKRNKERVNVYLDGEYAFSMAAIDAARLRKGQTLSEAEVTALRDEDQIAQAVDTAARFLAYRPRSETEVRRNLVEKDIPSGVIDAALERLVKMGYLDDTAFARFWVQNRSEFKPLSKKALRQELNQKGLDSTVIQEALEEVDETALAYQAAVKQAKRLRHPTRQDFRKKLISFLQRRGFSYSTTSNVVAQLIDELEESDPTYFEDMTDEE